MDFMTLSECIEREDLMWKNREDLEIIWREIEETNSIIQFFLIFFLFQVDIHLFLVYKNRSTPRQWILVPYSLSVL